MYQNSADRDRGLDEALVTDAAVAPVAFDTFGVQLEDVLDLQNAAARTSSGTSVCAPQRLPSLVQDPPRNVGGGEMRLAQNRRGH
jgi:hypothetical protein